MRLLTIILFQLLALVVNAQHRTALHGTVTKVIDGDTFEFTTSDSTYRIRMFGIDAPEKGQDFFEESRDALLKLILHRQVIIEKKDSDKYRRTVGIIYRKDDKLNVNYEMVQQGLAWHFARYSNDKELARLEATARDKQVGIWSLFHYLEPWEYRKGN